MYKNVSKVVLDSLSQDPVLLFCSTQAFGLGSDIVVTARTTLIIAIDIILILLRAFVDSPGIPIGQDEVAASAKAHKAISKSVHHAVTRLIPILLGIYKAFQFTKIQDGIRSIIEEYRHFRRATKKIPLEEQVLSDPEISLQKIP